MPSKRFRLAPAAALLLMAPAWALELPPFDPSVGAEEYVSRLLRVEPNHERRAEILTELAFFDAPDPEVRALSLRQLPPFKEKAVLAIEDRVFEIPVEQSEAAVRTLLAAREQMDWGFPRGYPAALEGAIWFGSEGARRLAIPEAARFKVRASVLPMIDATFEHPDLTPLVVEALGTLGDERARFWLDDRLSEGVTAAALSMARIGGKAAERLRERATDPNAEIRRAAVEALLENPNTLDLSALYAYYGSFPDDDAELRERVRDIAGRLEQLLQEVQARDSATPDDG